MRFARRGNFESGSNQAVDAGWGGVVLAQIASSDLRLDAGEVEGL